MTYRIYESKNQFFLFTRRHSTQEIIYLTIISLGTIWLLDRFRENARFQKTDLVHYDLQEAIEQVKRLQTKTKYKRVKF